LGFGLASYAHTAKQFTPAAEGAIARYRSRMGIAHSEYLQYAAEIGLPATLLLFALAGYLFHRAVRNAVHCSDDSRPIHEAAILSAAGIGAHGLIDNNWTVPVMAAVLVVFSLADSVPRRQWNFRYALPPRAAGAATIMIGLLIFLHSTFVPWLGLYFIHAGHRAHLERDFDTAESFHRMAVAIIPDHPVFLDTTGVLYLDMYRTTREQRFLDSADHFLDAAIVADPYADEPRRHKERALFERLTGDAAKDRQVHAHIIQVDRDLLRIDPFDPFTRKNLAEALYHSGLRREAKQEMMKTIEVEPNFVPAYARLAEWYRQEGDMDRSSELEKQATSIRTRYEHVEPAERYEALLLGRLDADMKQAAVISQ
jgi:tetratricopeptide (TPR) repeat protein